MPRKPPPETTAARAADQREEARRQSQLTQDLWLQAQRSSQRHLRRARKLRAEGHPADAIAELRAAIRACPTAPAHLDLAAALLDTGRGDEAFAEYQRALQIDTHPTDRYVELGIAFQRAGTMEALLAPFTDTFGSAPLEALRTAAILDPVEAFLQSIPERHRYRHQYFLECLLEDLRPACVWEALSVSAQELIENVEALYDPSRISQVIAGDAIRTADAFLRFIRDLGLLPDDPELNEWLDEEEPEAGAGQLPSDGA